MIYKQPSIYKQGYYPEIETHEHILQYADDWIETNNDWVLSPNTTCKFKEVGQTPQTINLSDAFNFLLSKKLKILHVQKKSNDVYCIVFNSTINDNIWHPLVRYIGSEFQTFFMGDANNPIITDYVYPIDVNRGEKLFQYYNTDLNSTPNFGTMSFTGSLNDISHSGIAIKMAIKTDNTPIAVKLDGLTYRVVLK